MLSEEENKPAPGKWRSQMFEVIFEADTPPGKLFDIILLISIVLSVFAVILESVEAIRIQYGEVLYVLEWFFTILFTVEYILRIISVRRPFSYIFSFYGVIDLLAIIPTYLSLVFAGTQYLLVIRGLRLLRVFRVLKLAHFMKEAQTLKSALSASKQKITVFLLTVLTMVIIIGALMYLIEGAEGGFTSIPRSIYWAIVTLTTVGYGDIAPQTVLGQFLAALVMITGYGIIAVPTGIVTAEMTRASIAQKEDACPGCGRQGHATDADFCKYCGTRL